jgi:hypothetical protein
LCDGDDFLHAYTIMHQYIDLQGKHKICQNELLKSNKYVFFQNYFFPMWLMFRVRNFEPNEYKQLVKWFLIESFPL